MSNFVRLNDVDHLTKRRKLHFYVMSKDVCLSYHLNLQIDVSNTL